MISTKSYKPWTANKKEKSDSTKKSWIKIPYMKALRNELETFGNFSESKAVQAKI